MTMRITVEITTADDEAYTPRELAIINAMQVHPSNGAAAAAAAAATTRTKVTEPVAAEEEDEAPAKPAARTRKPAATKAKVQEPAPAEEEAEEDDDLLGNGGGDTEYTLDDLVNASTELINAGKQGVVKGALADFGAKRVTELDAKDYAAYMAKIAD